MNFGKDKKDKVIEYDQITKGEYELHVLIECTSGLSLESDSSVDAKIAITAFGKTQYTKVKGDVGVEEVFWGEHVYFNTDFENSASAQNQRLLISVYDVNKFSVNSLVGNYEIDVQRIYSEPNHTLKHSWLALSNIQRNYTQITGYIKISASLLGQKDTNIQLDVQPVASITVQKKVLIPPQIQRKTYQIIVDVMQGKHLKPTDGDTVDSYVGIEFGQVYSQSNTIPKNRNPTYNTRVFVPMSLPAVIENIAFRVNDFNYIQKVQVLGSYYLNINQLIKNYQNPPPYQDPKSIGCQVVFENKIPLDQFRWINFYGPQLQAKQDAQKSVQQMYPKLAAAYCGSILMRVSIKRESRPETKKQNLDPDEVKSFKLDKTPPNFTFRLNTRVVAAINLFEKNRRYKIVVNVGPDEIQTKQVQAKNGFCFWSTQLSLRIFVGPNQKMPDIFIYLVNDKGQRICYLRYQPKLGIIQADQWVSLKPDTALVNMQSEQGGYLKLSIALRQDAKDVGALKQEIKIKKNDPIITEFAHPLSQAYHSNKKSGKVVIDLLCGQSLIPLDTDGGIDAFFNFNYMQSEVVSSMKNDTLNPVFYQRLIIQADVLEQNKCPPIIVNAYDKDKFTNQFLGSAFIDVATAVNNKSLVYGLLMDPEPYWYQLTQNGMVTGRFLVSIRLLPDYPQKFPTEMKIQQQDYQIHLVIMGLRSLKHSGMLSVKQPFIEFDFAALDIQKNTSEEVKRSRMIKTEPKQKGRNINISTVIPAKISLPTNYKLWPSLSAKVRDNVLGDMYQPTLGYFSINLKNSYLRSNQIKQSFKNRKKILLDNKSKIIERPPKLQGINQAILMNLRNFVMKSLNYNWQILDSGMKNDLIQEKPMKKIDDDYVILFPQYAKQKIGKIKKDKDGKQEEKFKYVQKYKELIQKNGNYMQIGFDDIKSRGSGTSKRNKHYRYVLKESYESYYERVFGHRLGLMDQIQIKVGRLFTSNDLMSNVLRNVSKEDMVSGKYKGQLFINEYKEIKTQQEQEFKHESQALLNDILKKGKVCMYLYVIEAANLPPKDNFSHSDPYLVVKGGKQKQSFQKQYFTDEPNPQFLKKVQMILQFPEDSTVDIEVWDYDPVVGDQLIGSVTIDIEDRLQVKMSSAKLNSPIQTHNLLISTSKRPQGLVRFWVDLVPFEHRSLYRQFDIRSAPPANFQIRIIVWSCADMPNDDIEDMSDLYVKCQFNDQIQQTDVHYRSSTGDGNFNWRLVYPVKLPIKNTLVTFKVYDKDVVTGDDFLASGSFDIRDYLEEAFQTNSSVTLMLGEEDLAKQSDVPGGKMHIINDRPRYDRFWVQTNNRTQEQPTNLQSQGKVQISLQIVTEEEAKRNPVGKGRQDPNQYPYLPNPKGRFRFSLNPMTMASQLCGPKFKGKIVLALYCAFCFVFVIYFGVSLGGSFVGAWIAK